MEGLVCCFAEDALVNDQLSEYSGKREIVDWAMRDIIAENLTLFVLREVTSYNNSNLTVEVDGDFNKRGLPEPLVLNFYVTIFDTKIVQLIMLRNQNYL